MFKNNKYVCLRIEYQIFVLNFPLVACFNWRES